MKSIWSKKMHELNSSLKRGIRKPATFRKYVGGLTFGEIPIKKVSYDIGDGNKLIEFYCGFLATRPLFLKTKILKNPTIMTATPIDAVSRDGAVRRIAIPIIIVIMLEE